MEDAATCEISRSQIWKWLHHPRGLLDDGRKVTTSLFQRIVGEELDKIRSEVGVAVFDYGQFELAWKIFADVATSDNFIEFLTLPAYDYLP